MLITIALDVEQNPGPRRPRYPCSLCDKAVTWHTPAVACDDCDKWTHTKCMNMPELVYEGLGDSSWQCTNCGMPQINSSFFKTFESTGSPSSQMDSSTEESDLELPDRGPLGNPLATSSPNKNRGNTNIKPWENMRTLVINFQSVRNKRAELSNVLSSYQPEIFIGNETWLNSNITSSEIFPSQYDIIRKDRHDGYGGSRSRN